MHEFFPGDYMRSFVACVSLSCGGLVDEIDRIVKKLKGSETDNHAWHREWSAMAAHLQGLAAAAQARGNNFTAASAYFRACNYYTYAERLLPPTEEKKIPTYKKALECFSAAIACRNELNLERVEVPYEGQSLPGYFVKPSGPPAKRPVIIFVGGLDSTKES